MYQPTHSNNRLVGSSLGITHEFLTFSIALFRPVSAYVAQQIHDMQIATRSGAQLLKCYNLGGKTGLGRVACIAIGWRYAKVVKRAIVVYCHVIRDSVSVKP